MSRYVPHDIPYEGRIYGIPEEVRYQFRWGHSKTCIWCGKDVVYGAGQHHSACATREHIVPIARGGAHTKVTYNVVTACRACNQQRGTSTSWKPYVMKVKR